MNQQGTVNDWMMYTAMMLECMAVPRDEWPYIAVADVQDFAGQVRKEKLEAAGLLGGESNLTHFVRGDLLQIARREGINQLFGTSPGNYRLPDKLVGLRLIHRPDLVPPGHLCTVIHPSLVEHEPMEFGTNGEAA